MERPLMQHQHPSEQDRHLAELSIRLPCEVDHARRGKHRHVGFDVGVNDGVRIVGSALVGDRRSGAAEVVLRHESRSQQKRN